MYNHSLSLKKDDLADKKILFKEGIIGFTHIKEYFFVDYNQEPFYWIQSVKDKNLVFLLVKMKILTSNYVLSIDPQDLKSIMLSDIEDLEDFLIVTVTDPMKEITANFLAPIIINKKNYLAKQVLSLNSNFHTKHSIYDSLTQYRVKNQRLDYAGIVKKT